MEGRKARVGEKVRTAVRERRQGNRRGGGREGKRC